MIWPNGEQIKASNESESEISRAIHDMGYPVKITVTDPLNFTALGSMAYISQEKVVRKIEALDCNETFKELNARCQRVASDIFASLGVSRQGK